MKTAAKKNFLVNVCVSGPASQTKREAVERAVRKAKMTGYLKRTHSEFAGQVKMAESLGKAYAGALTGRVAKR